MSKKVGLYFGSFNPIHAGHLNLAAYVVDHNIADELWFIVSPCNPLKRQTDLIDEHKRLEMVKLAIKNNPKLKVSDVEFYMPVPSYTIDTLRLLSSRYPSTAFSLLIGSDNARIFHNWKNYREILDHYQIMVYPRQGYDAEKAAAQYPQMIWLPTPCYDISSTEIRNDILQKKDASKWLPPAVYQYILDNRLYQ